MRLMKSGSVFFSALAFTLLIGCGKAEQLANTFEIKGNWLMTESENSNEIQRALDTESLVLTFKDGKAAFSPTDSVKGRAVYTALTACTAGPRTYRLENKDIIFEAITNCPEQRSTVTQLDADRLKFSDPDNTKIIRTFVRITEEKYQALVAAGDRHL